MDVNNREEYSFPPAERGLQRGSFPLEEGDTIVAWILKWRTDEWESYLLDTSSEFGVGHFDLLFTDYEINKLCEIFDIPKNIIPLSNLRYVSPKHLRLLSQFIHDIEGGRLKEILNYWVSRGLVLQGYLGSGAWGAVFKFTDKNRIHSVVKILKPPYDDEWRKRFRNEVTILHRLDKLPNVPRILSLPVDIGGIMSYRMEYISGKTLDNMKLPIDIQSAISIVRDIFRILGELDYYRIIHRDLHLGNIMQKTDNSICILDFGLARDEGGLEYTQTFKPVGAMTHCAPEKWQEPSKVKITSDIFSVGVLLYRLLSGNYPFWAETYIGLYELIKAGDHASLVDVNPEIPQTISIFVDALLEPFPNLRPKTPEQAAKLLSAMEEYRKIRLSQISEEKCPKCGSKTNIYTQIEYRTATLNCPQCEHCGYSGVSSIDLIS